jgi:hypothetical protein
MEIEEKIYEAKQLLYWLIDGYFRHGIPGDLWHKVTPQWVCESYNVEPEYFKI